MKTKEQIQEAIKQYYIDDLEKTMVDNIRHNDKYPLYFLVEPEKPDIDARKQVIKEIKAAGYNCEIEDQDRYCIRYKIEY